MLCNTLQVPRVKRSSDIGGTNSKIPQKMEFQKNDLDEFESEVGLTKRFAEFINAKLL